MPGKKSISDENQFGYAFARRAPEYHYHGLIQTFAKLASICQTYVDGRDSNDMYRRTLPTMFIRSAQETG